MNHVEKAFFPYYRSRRAIATPDEITVCFDEIKSSGMFQAFDNGVCQIIIHRNTAILAWAWITFLHEYRHYLQWRAGWLDFNKYTTCRRYKYTREVDAHQWAVLMFERHFLNDFPTYITRFMLIRDRKLAEAYEEYARTLPAKTSDLPAPEFLLKDFPEKS